MPDIGGFDPGTVVSELTRRLKTGFVRTNEPMKEHTSFKIGGPADVFVVPASVEELVAVLKYCRTREVPHFLMGRGSNLLVGDKGIRGVVIQVSDNLSEVSVDGTKVTAQTGATLRRLADVALNHSLTGLEFASGIPGTLGGAIAMNAGAYGGEMAHVLTEATVIDLECNLQVLSRDELELGYRTSALQTKGYIAVSGVLELARGNQEEIKARMGELGERRRSKQPLELPSCGSVFMRPPGHYAGKLIQDAGLKGKRIGGAQISPKHCGFIVNLGNATAQDVLQLIRLVQRTVKEKFGVDMNTEVRLVGEF